MGNPYKAKTRRGNPSPSTPKAPVGTVGELLAWVGEDKGRANLALSQENSEDRPRKSLVNALEEVIDG